MTVPHRRHTVRQVADDMPMVGPSGPSTTARRSSDQLAARAIHLAVEARTSLSEDAHALAALAGNDMLRLQQARRRLTRADPRGASAVIAHALAALLGAMELAAPIVRRGV